MSDLDRIREALHASLTAWASLEVRGEQARVVPAPDLDLLVSLLERLDPHWSLRWACDQTGPYVVRARLDILGTVREGLSSGVTLPDAKLAALAEAVRAFGVVAGEGHWVEYDPEEGPNTTELETAAEALPANLPAAALAATLPPEPARDPQMEKARRHIEDLLEQLKVAGKGGEATRVLIRGYGETLEESRAIYKELQGILKG